MTSKAAGKLTEEQVAEIKKEFALYDTNRDGLITSEDLGRVMRSHGQNPTEEYVKDAFAVVDTDATGVIDFTKFMNFMAHEMKEDYDPEVICRNTFKNFDKDKDGYISAVELREVMAINGQVVTEEEVKAMIKEADLDGDGKVNYEEFQKITRGSWSR